MLTKIDTNDLQNVILEYKRLPIRNKGTIGEQIISSLFNDLITKEVGISKKKYGYDFFHIKSNSKIEIKTSLPINKLYSQNFNQQQFLSINITYEELVKFLQQKENQYTLNQIKTYENGLPICDWLIYLLIAWDGYIIFPISKIDLQTIIYKQHGVESRSVNASKIIQTCKCMYKFGLPILPSSFEEIITNDSL